jgi:hypothetical protein
LLQSIWSSCQNKPKGVQEGKEEERRKREGRGGRKKEGERRKRGGLVSGGHREYTQIGFASALK